MLYIAKHDDKCCATCGHWNGVRVHEGDGHIYSIGHVEAVCSRRWDMIDHDKTCTPLTLPSDVACDEWEVCLEEAPADLLERYGTRRSRAFWRD